MNDDLETLSGIEAAVWSALESGVSDPSAPARTVALATEALDGGGSVRLVVLRAIDRADLCLTFFTHRGSGKIAELTAEPKVQVLVWDSARQFQIRISGEMEYAQGPQATWERFGHGTRRNYASSPAPGEVLNDPETVAFDPDPETFMQMTLRISMIETLVLSPETQRRARFTKDGAQWIAP